MLKRFFKSLFIILILSGIAALTGPIGGFIILLLVCAHNAGMVRQHGFKKGGYVPTPKQRKNAMSEEDGNKKSEAQRSVDAAVGFEMAVKQVLDHYMKDGLTVSQASGVLSLVKTEVEMSFFIKTGAFDGDIRNTVFSTSIQGS